MKSGSGVHNSRQVKTSSFPNTDEVYPYGPSRPSNDGDESIHGRQQCVANNYGYSKGYNTSSNVSGTVPPRGNGDFRTSFNSNNSFTSRPRVWKNKENGSFRGGPQQRDGGKNDGSQFHNFQQRESQNPPPMANSAPCDGSYWGPPGTEASNDWRNGSRMLGSSLFPRHADRSNGFTMRQGHFGHMGDNNNNNGSFFGSGRGQYAPPHFVAPNGRECRSMASSLQNSFGPEAHAYMQRSNAQYLRHSFSGPSSAYATPYTGYPNGQYMYDAAQESRKGSLDIWASGPRSARKAYSGNPSFTREHNEAFATLIPAQRDREAEYPLQVCSDDQKCTLINNAEHNRRFQHSSRNFSSKYNSNRLPQELSIHKNAQPGKSDSTELKSDVAASAEKGKNESQVVLKESQLTAEADSNVPSQQTRKQQKPVVDATGRAKQTPTKSDSRLFPRNERSSKKSNTTSPTTHSSSSNGIALEQTAFAAGRQNAHNGKENVETNVFTRTEKWHAAFGPSFTAISPRHNNSTKINLVVDLFGTVQLDSLSSIIPAKELDRLVSAALSRAEESEHHATSSIPHGKTLDALTTKSEIGSVISCVNTYMTPKLMCDMSCDMSGEWFGPLDENVDMMAGPASENGSEPYFRGMMHYHTHFIDDIHSEVQEPLSVPDIVHPSETSASPTDPQAKNSPCLAQALETAFSCVGSSVLYFLQRRVPMAVTTPMISYRNSGQNIRSNMGEEIHISAPKTPAESSQNKDVVLAVRSYPVYGDWSSVRVHTFKRYIYTCLTKNTPTGVLSESNLALRGAAIPESCAAVLERVAEANAALSSVKLSIECIEQTSVDNVNTCCDTKNVQLWLLRCSPAAPAHASNKGSTFDLSTPVAVAGSSNGEAQDALSENSSLGSTLNSCAQVVSLIKIDDDLAFIGDYKIDTSQGDVLFVCDMNHLQTGKNTSL